MCARGNHQACVDLIATILSTLIATSSVAAEPRDPLEYGPWIAAVEGGWSLVLTAGWIVGAQSWDPPVLRGISSLIVARVMYGTSWSALLAGEVALARWIAGPRWEGLSQANFRAEWWIGFEVPGPCKSSCIGLGGFDELRVGLRPPLEFAASSGWIQGRVLHDRHRTELEATWVQSPIGLRVRPKTSLGPFDLQWALGPALFWGLHNKHVHGREDVPWHGVFVIDAGLGPGIHADFQLDLGAYLALGADLDLSLFVLANETDRPLVFRRISAGLTLHPPEWSPVAISLRWLGLELSRREVSKLGHRALMVRFDFPIFLDED